MPRSQKILALPNALVFASNRDNEHIQFSSGFS
jgi:hypothetical protein